MSTQLPCGELVPLNIPYESTILGRVWRVTEL
jgi:hypothetical protein